MTKQQEKKPERVPLLERHSLLWAVVAIFIVAAIAGMWAVDYYYAPEMISQSTLPEAVGK
jgi:hypothetical protein